MIAAYTTDTHFGWNGVSHNHHNKRLHKLKEEMEARGCRLLFHSGDWGVFRQRQTRRTLEMFREILGKEIIIVGCLGNHDFWISIEDGELYTLRELFDLHDEWMKAFDIHYLDGRDTPVVVEDIAIIGFDGWYANPNIHALSNDIKYMPKHLGDAHAFMQKRSYDSFNKMLNLDTSFARKVVGITHFPLLEGDFNGNPKWLEFMSEKCDSIFFGHSHERIDGQQAGKSRLYNAGSDYGNIRYHFIEV